MICPEKPDRNDREGEINEIKLQFSTFLQTGRTCISQFLSYILRWRTIFSACYVTSVVVQANTVKYTDGVLSSYSIRTDIHQLTMKKNFLLQNHDTLLVRFMIRSRESREHFYRFMNFYVGSFMKFHVLLYLWSFL